MKRKKGFMVAMIVCIIVVLTTVSCFAFRSLGLDKDDKTIVINYWTHEDISRTKLEDRLIVQFERMNPGIKINRQVYSSSDILNVVPTAFEASRAPDVFTMQQDYLSPILNKGYLDEINLDSLGYSSKKDLEDAYIDGAFECIMKDGGIYGIPMEFTNWCLYVNKNLFKEAGLNPDKDYPKTWNDMVDVCSKLVQRENGILTTRGFDFRYPHYLTFFIPMVEQLGGSLVFEDNKIYIENEEAWLKAITFMQEWGPQGLNLGSPTYINARSIFNDGKIAMMLSGLYQEERLREENPDLYYSDDWMVVPFPTFEGGRDVACAKYSHYWCVNDSSSESVKNACWRFVAFLASHGIDYLNEVRLLMPLKSVVDNLEALNIPYLDVFFSQLNKASSVYCAPGAGEVASVLEGLMKEVMLSGLDPEKALIRLKVSLSEIHP